MKPKRTSVLVVAFVGIGLLPGMDTAQAVGDSVGLNYGASASGTQEIPVPGVETGRANGLFKFDRRLSGVAVEVQVAPAFPFASGITAAHLHCARPGENGDIILDLVPTTGVVDGEVVSGVFTNDDVVAEADCQSTCGFAIDNIASLRAAALGGCIYVNVHTQAAPAGEARGQLLRVGDSLEGHWIGTTSQGLAIALDG